MSRIPDEQIAQNSCGACPAASPTIPLGRRELLVLASQVAAASALSACGGDAGTDTPLPETCPGVQATGAEALQVGQALRMDMTPMYQSFLVCRDAKGFYALANVCQHAGCQTAINAAAMTFDCPCHGSRYKFDGSILNGPTTWPLKGYALCRRADGMLFVDNSNFVTDTTGRVK